MAPTTAACGFNITEYALPHADSGPNYITAGPDGALWFAEGTANKIGRITTSGSVTEYPIPTASSFPLSITAGPDGALWFTEYNAGKIGRITTGGTITEYAGSVGTFTDPWIITPGPDGALWFTDYETGDVGRITTAGVATEYYVPGTGFENESREPFGLVAGPDGALWITDRYNFIERMNTNGTVTNKYATGTTHDPYQIAVGPDGALWFSQSFSYSIGRITTSGTLTNYTTIEGNGESYSNGIAAGADGAMWFALTDSAIGRMTTSGSVEECPTPTAGSIPLGMTAGPDGAMWFTENGGNNIGRIAVTVEAAARVRARVIDARGK